MPEYDHEAEWLGYKRDDAIRTLRDRGWEYPEARDAVHGIPDEVFQIIRSQAVAELAECYIHGMRATIRIREAMRYSAGMMPPETERSLAAKQARIEGLKVLSRRTSSSEGPQ